MGHPVRLEANPHAVCRVNTKVVPPHDHSLRNRTATTTNLNIEFLQHSSPDCIGTISFTRPTDGRPSRPGPPSGIPKLPLARLALTSVHRNCEKLAGTAPDEPPKSDSQLLPSRGSSLCGLKVRSPENHPLRDGLVGKPRPLGSETFKKSRGFLLIRTTGQ